VRRKSASIQARFVRHHRAESGVNSSRSLILHPWQDMTINVQREADCRMSQALADHLRVDALAQQLRRVGVSQVVETDVGQSRSTDLRSKGAGEPVRSPRLSMRWQRS